MLIIPKKITFHISAIIECLLNLPISILARFVTEIFILINFSSFFIHLEQFSIRVHDVLKNRCPAELKDENFSFEKVMLIATIDCDIEGKISRRFVNDIIDRKINRSNAIKLEDFVKLNVCQVHAALFLHKISFS